jgi:hypothetical protein
VKGIVTVYTTAQYVHAMQADVPTSASLRGEAQNLLLAAAPEFLGALAAALVVAAATWACQCLRRRLADRRQRRRASA